MWLFTRYGFFSVSCPDWDRDKLQVRARCKRHLAELQNRFPHLVPFPIRESPNNDYRYRMIVPNDVWVETVSMLAKEQTWSNFKTEAARFQNDKAYDHALHEIWSLMYEHGMEWQKKEKQQG